MVLKKETAWLLLADGAAARIYEEDSPEHYKLLKEFSSVESHKLTREIVSDEPGRSHDRFGAHRHALESRSDPQEVEKEKFVKSVATHINAAALNGECDVLTLCAPPRVLGELREYLDKHGQKLVKAEFHKDLMKTPLHELSQHLTAPAKE